MTNTEKKNEPLNSSTLAAMKEAKDIQKNPTGFVELLTKLVK